MADVEAAERVCVVVYDYKAPRDSWGVLVTGELHAVPTEDERFDDAEINRRFPDLRVFDEDVAEFEIEHYELRKESMTGR